MDERNIAFELEIKIETERETVPHCLHCLCWFLCILYNINNVYILYRLIFYIEIFIYSFRTSHIWKQIFILFGLYWSLHIHLFISQKWIPCWFCCCCFFRFCWCCVFRVGAIRCRRYCCCCSICKCNLIWWAKCAKTKRITNEKRQYTRMYIAQHSTQRTTHNLTMYRIITITQIAWRGKMLPFI